MNAVQRVVIRVDASIEMGMGHLMRCLSLARALADDGANVFFLLRSHAAGLTRLIEGEGHSVRLLPDPDGRRMLRRRTEPPMRTGCRRPGRRMPSRRRRRSIASAQSTGSLSTTMHSMRGGSACSASGCLASLRSMILPIGTTTATSCSTRTWFWKWKSRYRGRLPATCKPLLGPPYALLRREFAERRKSLRERSGKVGRILVCYGGSDPG